MTIRNFTFFSPTGTEFPVSSNADAKLYMMLSGMKINTYKRTDWETPVDTALNRQYSNTSLVVGGRYFELEGETVELQPSVDNYIHANIDLTNTATPVSVSVELADNSNSVDINNGSGVLKQCFDIVTTDSMGVIAQRIPSQVTTLDKANLPSGEVFGITLNNGWTEEKIGDNLYRWTRLYTRVTGITASAGSALFQSGDLTYPASPLNANITQRFVRVGNAPWASWAVQFSNHDVYRLMSFSSRASGQVNIEAVFYGSKTS